MRGRVASLLEVGTGFHPELTGRENIFLNGAILGMKRAEIKRKFDEIVAFAEVERFLDTPVKRYSSGMYVRLAFAVAAHLEPEILIVDEVLAVGDAEFQKKCLGKMQDVASKQGRTVLFVSHNMAAVESMCGSALLLVDGRCVARGDTSIVVQEYLRDMSRVSATPLGQRTDREGSGDVRFVSHVAGRFARCRCVGIPMRNGSDYCTLSWKIARKVNCAAFASRWELTMRWASGSRCWIPCSLALEFLAYRQVGKACASSFRKWPLIPAVIELTLYSTVNGIIADWIKNAAVFDVESGDYYGTGHLPAHGEGMFFWTTDSSSTGYRAKFEIGDTTSAA